MTIPLWITVLIPLGLSAACLYLMLRPYQQEGDYDIGCIFRIFWLVPVGFVWAVYFFVLWLVARHGS